MWIETADNWSEKLEKSGVVDFERFLLMRGQVSLPKERTKWLKIIKLKQHFKLITSFFFSEVLLRKFITTEFFKLYVFHTVHSFEYHSQK